MKVKLVTALIVLTLAQISLAIGDISVGPFYGMAVPIKNDLVKTGPMYGVQAKLSLFPMLAIGAHYSSRSYGNPSQVFFEGQPIEVTMEIDGGDVQSLGAEAYLGKGGGMPGLNFYFIGSVSTYKWKRDGLADISKSAFAVGPGAEIVLPMKLGIEGRALVEVASTGHDGSWKSLLWFVGINYHLGLGPM